MKLEVNFRNYLDNTDLVPISFVELENQGYQIKFSSKVGADQFERIKEFLHIKPTVRFWATKSYDKGRELISSEEFVICEGDTVTIRMPHFKVFYNVYELIKSFGVKIDGAKIGYGEISFEYKLKGRSVLNYDELGLIQNEVDPRIQSHDSCRQMGCGGDYTLNIRFDKR